MTETAGDSFDLVNRPWILAQRLDGRVDELSIVDVFRLAGQLRGVLGDVPTQTFAVTRMLLAILHRATGPADLQRWEELWRAETLPAEVIEQYLQHFGDRFDLLHPTKPFYQVAGLHTAKNEVFGLGRLIADVPNGAPYFTTRQGSGLERITLAEAARWVVHCQAFDFSGIKSGAVDDPRVKNGKGYPIGTAWAGELGGVFAEGRNLRETLLLNLITADVDYLRSSRDDKPAWEREPENQLEAGDLADRPYGRLDLYTWQSRRIRLFADADGVYGVVIANGEPLKPQNKHPFEPMTAWRRSEAQEKKLKASLVYMPRQHSPELSIWRGLGALLPSAPRQEKLRPPGVLAWIGHLQDEEKLGEDFPVRTRVIGMTYGSQQATTAEIVDDALSLSVALLQEHNLELGTAVVGAAGDAEAGARAFGHLAADLAQAAGGDPAGPRSRGKESAYAALDRPFRAWLARLGSRTSPLEARRAWQLAARRLLEQLGNELIEQSGPAAWVGRLVGDRHVSAPEADIRFRRGLDKAFELAALARKTKGKEPVSG